MSGITLDDGSAMSPEWMSAVMTKNKNKSVDIEHLDFIPAKQLCKDRCEVTRILLKTDDEAIPKSFLWKNIAVKDLPHVESNSLGNDKYTFNRETDIDSYENEMLFYQNYSTILNNSGIRVPKCYLTINKYDPKDKDNSKFSLLLEDLVASGFVKKHILLTKDEVIHSIEYLANLHGKYWGKTGTLDKLWNHGTFWSSEKRTENVINEMPQTWREFCSRFKGENVYFCSNDIIRLGERLHNQRFLIKQKLNQMTTRTFVHGNFKTSNILFRQGESGIEAAAVDWKWSGIGHPIQDIMFLLLGAFNAGLGLDENPIEKRVISTYCKHLNHLYKIQYDIEQATSDFKFALLDFAFVILGHFFRGQTPDTIRNDSSDPEVLSLAISVDNVVHLTRYLDRLLVEIEPRDTLDRPVETSISPMRFYNSYE
ncbi:hypothetical protein AKO1_011519, partial [Acrasis kona]